MHIKTPDWFFVCEMLDGVDITFMTFIAVADVWQFHWIKLTEYRWIQHDDNFLIKHFEAPVHVPNHEFHIQL